MKRRTLLSTIPLFTGISGCVNTGGDANTNGEGNQTDGANNSISEEDSKLYEYQEGNSLVDVAVHEDFNGSGVLEADCRDEDYSIKAGEEFSIDRKEDGESCSFQLYTSGKEEYGKGVSGAGRLELEVTGEGNVRDRQVTL